MTDAVRGANGRGSLNMRRLPVHRTQNEQSKTRINPVSGTGDDQQIAAAAGRPTKLGSICLAAQDFHCAILP